MRERWLYEGLTEWRPLVRDICNLVNTSSPNFYPCFGSKECIVMKSKMTSHEELDDNPRESSTLKLYSRDPPGRTSQLMK